MTKDLILTHQQVIPYFVYKAQSGFAVDLLMAISSYFNQDLNQTFQYTLDITPDGKYGVINNDTINGMLGEVHKGVSAK